MTLSYPISYKVLLIFRNVVIQAVQQCAGGQQCNTPTPGSDPCLSGPSYWCQSPTIALACGSGVISKQYYFPAYIVYNSCLVGFRLLQKSKPRAELSAISRCGSMHLGSKSHLHNFSTGCEMWSKRVQHFEPFLTSNFNQLL